MEKVTSRKLIIIDGEKYVPLDEMPQDIQVLYNHFDSLKPDATQGAPASVYDTPKRSIETSIAINGTPVNFKKFAENLLWVLGFAAVLAYFYYKDMWL